MQRGERSPLEDAQHARERQQREGALGQRARSVLRGDLGPVLRRWANVSVGSVATRLRTVAEAVHEGRLATAADALGSAMFGAPRLGHSASLAVVLAWCLKGKSPGRGEETTYAEDLVLAVLGTAIQRLAVSDGPAPLASIVGACASAAQETALGQFITSVQGSKAMQRVRKGGKASWKQGKTLNEIAGLLGGQVRHGLDQADEQAGDEVVEVGGRAVVSILTRAGDTRRIQLRKPAAGDWDLLEVATHAKGMKDTYRNSVWAPFAMMILCAAQAEGGWFDLVEMGVDRRKAQRRHKGAHGLVLSPEATAAIKNDLAKWMQLGFIKEPMVVPPVDGDYLTVKHRKVAGGRGPMGVRTDVSGSGAWRTASAVLAGTPWSVAGGTLRAIREGGALSVLAAKAEPNEVRRASILTGYGRLAAGDFYLPIQMDFRGRVYTQPSVVTYQGTDLQKGLMQFPEKPRLGMPDAASLDAITLHLGALYGGPEKLDKAPLEDRRKFLEGVRSLEDLVDTADEPIQFYTAIQLLKSGQWDAIPCQIDGTCNGLQHISALFRDDTAAPYVNLSASTLADRPSDIYAEVARRALLRLAACREPWARRVEAAIRVDRKLCKKPVMVLPYGGTRSTIEEAVLEAILEQAPWADYWRLGLRSKDAQGFAPHADWVEGNYAAFKDRDLKDHPLLHLDAKRLGGLIWDCIVEILPRAMAAMETFRAIAKAVGERSLEWSLGGEDPLWVIQAKAKSARSSINTKGFHLPGSVRGLALQQGRDEIDAKAHTTGIVANFIHSQDGRHLHKTMDLFQRTGEPMPFGAIHDCFITRPSRMEYLAHCTRSAFSQMYLEDPLMQPVRLRYEGGNNGGGQAGYANWHELAKECGVSFPEPGKWGPEEVLESAWFFS